MPKIRGIWARPGESSCEALRTRLPDTHPCSDQLLLKDRANFMFCAPRTVFLSSSCAFESLVKCRKIPMARPHPQRFGSSGLRWGPRQWDFSKASQSDCVSHVETLIRGLLVAPSATLYYSSLVSYLKSPQHTQIRTDGVYLTSQIIGISL